MKTRVFFWLLCLLPLAASAQHSDQVDQILASQPDLPYRYVNASSLLLRIQPTLTSRPIAKVGAASRVQVLDVRTDGWHEVRVGEQAGYVKSSYLVDDQQQVTADAVDWAQIQAAGGPEYTNVVPVAAPPALPTKAPVTSRNKTTKRPQPNRSLSR